MQVMTSQRPRVWLVFVVAMLYPLLRFSAWTPNPALLVMTQAVAYAVSVYLIYGICTLTSTGRNYAATALTTLSLGLAFLLSPQEVRLAAVVSVSMVTLVPAICGYLYANNYSKQTIFFFGALAIAFLCVFYLLPQWQQINAVMRDLGETALRNLEQQTALSGVSIDTADALIRQFRRIVDVSLRLLPATLVLGNFAQLAVGLLLFLVTVARNNEQESVPSLWDWRVPFGSLVILIAAALMRLIGTETLTYIGDNVLAVLAVVYSVAGFALSGYLMRFFGLPWYVRAAFYILVILSGLVGFLTMTLLGIIDSFTDWRSRIAPAGKRLEE